MIVLDREGTGGTLTIGERCKIDDSAEFDTSSNITIGDDVSISGDVLILTHDHAPEDVSRKTFSSLTIGDRAWIGTRAIILASCISIGEGACVGAGAVVTHDVPPNSLVAGNPARVIKTWEWV